MEPGINVERQLMKEVALQILWRYDPVEETGFSETIKAFVDYWGKQPAGRLLLVPPITLHRWLNQLHTPRGYVRAGLRARMIEVLSDVETFKNRLDRFKSK